MSNLNKLLQKQIQKFPNTALAKLIGRKLKEQGIADNIDTISAEISQYIISGGKEIFTWGDGKEPHYEITLSFSKEEADELEQTIDKFLKDDLPDLILEIIQSTANSKIRNYKKDWPEIHIWQRAELQKFKDNLELRWGRAFTLLRMILEAGREVGNERYSGLMRSKAKQNLKKREVLTLLHVRACQTVMEIIALLENGFADGAMARWRTLYELTVIAELIAKHDDDLARRYLDHVHVAAKKELDIDRRLRGGERTAKRDKIEEAVEQNYINMLGKYGGAFGGDYGWAAHHLQIKNPRFRHIEAGVEMFELPPEYKWASYKIHAGVSGVTWNLGQVYRSGTPIAGASNAGLDTPALYTAFSFVRMTTVIVEHHSKLENQIAVQMLVQLRDEAEKEFRRAAKKLYQDEMRQHRLNE